MRRGFTVWEALAVLIVVSIGLSILLPYPHGSRENARRSSCQSNLKELGLAFKQYAEDYDDYLPFVERFNFPQNVSSPPLPYGWADAILPYTKAPSLFQCPSENVQVNNIQDATKDDYTDYYFNANLTDFPRRDIVSKDATIMLGDGRDGIDLTNARYAYRALPPRWLQDENSPAYRHLGGANYAFVDGHVKWFKPELIKDVRTNSNDFSFTIR